MAEVPIVKIRENEDANRRLPEVIFIEDVPQFVRKWGEEKVAEALNNAYNKFKFTESQFVQYRNSVLKKLPEISRSLDLLKTLIKKREDENRLKFQLNDGLFLEGVVPKQNNSVALWLGSDIMVEYTYEEAVELLTANLKKAEYSVETYTEDLDFLKEQITCCEVNMSRVHNHLVTLKQQAQANQTASQ